VPRIASVRSLQSRRPTAGAAGAATRTSPRRRLLENILWSVASIGLFVAIWEASWAAGLISEASLPPPHIFLRALPDQVKFFETNAVGEVAAKGVWAVGAALLATTLRVFSGLALGFTAGVLVGLSSQYFKLFGKLVIPTISMLAPISPLAWLPVAVFSFGAGNGPAVFLVFVAVFFIITLAAVSEVASVNENFINVARNMGATRWQIYRHVIVPAILPALFNILRFNLFGAWMVVLVAEAAGVGSGVGLIILLARNTLNIPLVFAVMTVIGIAGFLCDWLLREVQRRTLYWLPDDRLAAAM
jgi:NitT/TauT family transport system permease protein